jgi:methionyl-tRNA formyltransferase
LEVWVRLVFLGTPEFAVPTLDAVLAAGHQVVGVYCQPPRPAGRGQRAQPCAVEAFARDRQLPVRSPASLKPAGEQQGFAALAADAAVVAAYGLILPAAVLAAPPYGCLNVHPSLLPRWRGAAPIQRAILAGDSETGVTIMQIDQGLDSGPLLLASRVPITATTTAAALHDALARIGAELMVEALAGLSAGTLRARPQPAAGVTYAAKLARDDGRLDWSRPAAELERAVRALNPWPGTWFGHRDQRIRVLAAEVVAGSGEPGTVLDDNLTVVCGTAALRITRVQRSGKSPMPAAAFLLGYPLPAGTRLA